jgi:hypothetical protein
MVSTKGESEYIDHREDAPVWMPGKMGMEYFGIP